MPIRPTFHLTDTAPAVPTPPPARRTRSGRPQVTRVDQRVLDTAKALAGGDPSRLVLQGPSAALVVNPGTRRRWARWAARL